LELYQTNLAIIQQSQTKFMLPANTKIQQRIEIIITSTLLAYTTICRGAKTFHNQTSFLGIETESSVKSNVRNCN
jgi:hypothetical protein